MHENKAHTAKSSLKEDTLSLFYKDCKKELKIFQAILKIAANIKNKCFPKHKLTEMPTVR